MTDPTEHPRHDPGDPTAASAKGQVRAAMRKRLAALDPDERRRASAEACARLMSLDAFRQATSVMLYMPLATEVDTTPLAIRCFQSGKTVCVPRVDWKRKDMHAVDVRSFDDHFMEIDEHGLRAPRDGHPVPPTMIDLVVVPALAFDTEGNRLGRGGGFYDRFLSRLRRSATAIGLAFDLQITDDLPTDERDVRVDGVVTDRRVCGPRPSRSAK